MHGWLALRQKHHGGKNRQYKDAHGGWEAEQGYSAREEGAGTRNERKGCATTAHPDITRIVFHQFPVCIPKQSKLMLHQNHHNTFPQLESLFLSDLEMYEYFFNENNQVFFLNKEKLFLTIHAWKN